MTAGEFSTWSIVTLWPTSVRILLIPYLQNTLRSCLDEKVVLTESSLAVQDWGPIHVLVHLLGIPLVPASPDGTFRYSQLLPIYSTMDGKQKSLVKATGCSSIFAHWSYSWSAFSYLGIWVVRRLEAHLLNPHFFEENSHETCVSVNRKIAIMVNDEVLPIKSANVRFRSATTPSTWWNSARCVASMVSFLKTLSMLNSLAGRKPSSFWSVAKEEEVGFSSGSLRHLAASL